MDKRTKPGNLSTKLSSFAKQGKLEKYFHFRGLKPTAAFSDLCGQTESRILLHTDEAG
jgi:hypothetical protein